MEKKQRDRAKKKLKQSIYHVLGENVSCSAKLNNETGKWQVWMSVDCEAPEGLNQVIEGMNKDEQRPEVLSYMKEQGDAVIRLMNKHLQAEYTPEKENDFNFTVTFPPMFSVKRDGDILRMKTEEEREQDKVLHPTLLDMIEIDSEVIKAGYYEFKGYETHAESDGFALVKYAGIRARYQFDIPQQKEAVLS
jgi:hypothetical protein